MSDPKKTIDPTKYDELELLKTRVDILWNNQFKWEDVWGWIGAIMLFIIFITGAYTIISAGWNTIFGE